MPKSGPKGDEKALADEIARILGKPLPKNRPEPVLLNSTAERILDEQKLEIKAKKALAAEKKRAVAARRQGLGRSNPEKEKALKKTATKGVVKLFNAIRQAQQPSSTNKQESREDRPGPKAPVAVDKFFDLLGAGNGDLAGHEEHHDAPDDVSLSDGSDD